MSAEIRRWDLYKGVRIWVPKSDIQRAVTRRALSSVADTELAPSLAPENPLSWCPRYCCLCQDLFPTFSGLMKKVRFQAIADPTSGRQRGRSEGASRGNFDPEGRAQASDYQPQAVSSSGRLRRVDSERDNDDNSDNDDDLECGAKIVAVQHMSADDSSAGRGQRPEKGMKKRSIVECTGGVDESTRSRTRRWPMDKTLNLSAEEVRRRRISTALHNAFRDTEPTSRGSVDNVPVPKKGKVASRESHTHDGPDQELNRNSSEGRPRRSPVDVDENITGFERGKLYSSHVGDGAANVADDMCEAGVSLKSADICRDQPVGRDGKPVRSGNYDDDGLNAEEAHVTEALANLEAVENPDAWTFGMDNLESGDLRSGQEASNGTDESMFEFTPVSSDELRSRLDTNISKRSSPRVCPRLPARQSRFDSPSENGIETMRVLSRQDRQPQTVKSQWLDLLHMLKRTKPDFFSSDEATVKNLTPTSQGRAAYFALPLNQYNNLDLQSIYVMEYDRKVRTGCSLASFKQLLTVAGQYMRMHVMLGHVNVADVWQSGAVFRSVCDMDTLDLFFDMFEARGQGTTVVTKALHLKKLAKHAVAYLSDKDRGLQSQAERASMKIGGVFNAYKSRARSLATERKKLEHRLMEGKFFFPQDLKDCMDTSISHLSSIKAGVNMLEAGENREWAMEAISRNDTLIRKWFINILLLLLFSAGGQRPQVYSQLQVPTSEEMADIEDSAQRMKFFELRTLKEKSRRSLDMPNVIVPAKVLPFLKFHLNFMRPIVVKRANVTETPGQSQPILMHTEHGAYLTTAQIGLCLRNFLKMHRPDLADATVMSLRSSYGTMMMQAYRDEAESAGEASVGSGEPDTPNRRRGNLKQLFMDMF